MSRWFYLNGKFVQEEQALIPITQTGLQRAYGIFDLFRTVNGVPRFMPDYLNRFDNSQKFLGLSRTVSRSTIEEAVAELQERNGYAHSNFKLLLLGDGQDDPQTLYEPHLSIINTQIDPEPPKTGLSVLTHEFVREFPEMKSLNYLNSYALHQKRIAMKAGEVVYHQNGQVSEASRCNIFAIKDGTLITAERNILKGITRMHVLKAAEAIMPVSVGELSLETFENADELFATSTMKNVMPIVAVNGQSFQAKSNYLPKLQKAFAEHVTEELSAVR